MTEQHPTQPPPIEGEGHTFRQTEIQVPGALAEAVLAVPDVKTALAEARWLVEPIYGGVMARHAEGTATASDLAVLGLIMLLARCSADHPDALPDALEPNVDGESSTVRETAYALYVSGARRYEEQLAEQRPPAPDDRPTPGLYL